jgi:hypothetical protein
MTDLFGPDDPDDFSYDDTSFQPWYTGQDTETGLWDDHWLDEGEPAWWDSDITLFNSYGNDITFDAETWFNLTLEQSEVLEAAYGIDNLDIIHQLEDQGFWDADDWDYWREEYGES